MTSNQEISCYGEDGIGDSGDDWTIICSSEFWLRDITVKFQHVDTEYFLTVSGRTFGRPINGQMEVIGMKGEHNAANWKSVEGIFVNSIETKEQNFHDEF